MINIFTKKLILLLLLGQIFWVGLLPPNVRAEQPVCSNPSNQCQVNGQYDARCIGTCGCVFQARQCKENGCWESNPREEKDCSKAPAACNKPCSGSKIGTEDSVQKVFGKIVPPPAIQSIGFGAEGINQLIRVGINLLFIVGAVACLFFVIWGAIQYMSAGTQKDGAAEARKKITYALTGLALLGLSFFIVRLVGNIVGLGDLFEF